MNIYYQYFFVLSLLAVEIYLLALSRVHKFHKFATTFLPFAKCLLNNRRD